VIIAVFSLGYNSKTTVDGISLFSRKTRKRRQTPIYYLTNWQVVVVAAAAAAVFVVIAAHS